MPTYVVPMDGSDFAERALRPAAVLAARHRDDRPARVLLLACTWPDDPPIEARLEDRAALLDGVVDVDIRVLEAVEPVEGILQTLAVVSDPILCMATHGHGGLRAAVLGSVAERILCRSTDPIVLVGPEVGPAILPGERGRMIVCSDGSPFADAIVPTAARWAGEQRFEPWLVEVIGPDEAVHAPGEPSVGELRSAAERRLATLATHLPSLDGPARTKVLYGTPASRSITSFAASLPAALIVMATHGRTGLARTALGSVATEVVRHAPCPVVVHRPAEPDA